MSEEHWKIPDEWEWSTIGESCQVNQRDPRLRGLPDDLPVSFVPMAAVDAERGAIATPEARPLGKVRKGFTPFADGDVIFAKITPCMENGKAAIARGLTNGLGFGSTEFHVMRPNKDVSPEWVFYFVRREAFRNEAKANFAGTAGQLRVPYSFVQSAPIPLAPFPEQRRIVAKIEQLFEQSRTAREALDGVPALMKRFRQSVLASAFRGELTERDPNDEPASVLLERIRAERQEKFKSKKHVEPEPPDTSDLPKLPHGWVWTTLPTLGELARGKSKHRPRDEKSLYGGAYPFVQTGDIARAKGVITAYTQTYSEAGLAQSRLWPKGTLCITIAANIADTAILGFDACFPDSVVGFIADEDVCDIRFVEYFIRTAKEDLEQFAPATAQKNINLGTLQKLAVPLAPLAEQRRIVAKVESLFAQADAVERAVEVARRRAEKVDQAILAGAFRGEL